MIEDNYKKSKDLVLSAYDEFCSTSKLLGKHVNSAIKEHIENIRKEKFHLMIVGEAKSGKSTFINAFLGKEILPMDVQQCTSSIIEVSHDDNFKLIATRADGKQFALSGEKEVQSFLRGTASLQEQYRRIPVTTINNEIILRYKGAPIKRNSLNKFLDDMDKLNYYNLERNEYRTLIENYIEETNKNWQQLVIKIEIRCPISEAMKGIVIIDSPGVNAEGNVGEVADNYIDKANAVIFVKSLNGQAVESTSFTNFLKTKSGDRNKDTMFLVLTGISNMSEEEIDRLYGQACEIFSNISSEKIICVDSKVQLFLNKCKALGDPDAIDDFFDRLADEKKSFDSAEMCWLRSRGRMDKFEKLMNDKSRFEDVRRVMDKYAQTARYIALIDTINNLIKEYSRYQLILKDKKTVLKASKGSIDALARNVSDKQDKMTNLRAVLYDEIENIYRKYGNLDGEIETGCEKLRQRYRKQTEFYKSLAENEITDDTFVDLETFTARIIDDFKLFRDEYGKKIINEFNQKLASTTRDRENITFEFFEPNFTQSDFKKINEEARIQTEGYTDVEKGACFTRLQKEHYHHKSEHVKLVLKYISEEFDSICNKMKQNLYDYLEMCCKIYRDKLVYNIDDVKKEYGKMVTEENSSNDMQGAMDTCENSICVIDQNIENLKILREEIDAYVHG